jgi:SAM-dependent methyltransferase
MTHQELATSWTRLMAPASGDIRAELVAQAADFLGISVADAWSRLRGAGDRFKDEWSRTMVDPADERALARFYNQSDTELFELIEWHASDPIHYRTLIVSDLALQRRGRLFLDYGSGIGSDALVLGHAGFSVTLADISDILLAFAAYRCRRCRIPVQTIDLKTAELPVSAFDLVVCFDVLEHIPQPLSVVRRIERSLRAGGLIVIHAPFGKDPDHPMHVVHHDVVTPRMRSLGFRPVNCDFPVGVRAPRVYEKASLSRLDRLAYFVYDQYLNDTIGGRVAQRCRALLRRPAANLPVS